MRKPHAESAGSSGNGYCAFLAGVNALTTPHYWWVLWVMAGWGLGLILDLIFHLTKLSDDDDAE